MLVHLTARLRTDRIDEYDRLHDSIPPSVVEGLAAAGARRWIIWREGAALHQIVECDDWDALDRAMNLTVPADWTATMATLTDVDGEREVRRADYFWSLEERITDARTWTSGEAGEDVL